VSDEVELIGPQLTKHSESSLATGNQSAAEGRQCAPSNPGTPESLVWRLLWTGGGSQDQSPRRWSVSLVCMRLLADPIASVLADQEDNLSESVTAFNGSA
jgi:hypothetical protein